MMDFAVYAVVIVTLFAIVDPIRTLPFLVALTEGFVDADRKVVPNRSVRILASVLTGLALAGRFRFEVCGFTLLAFEIARGTLPFMVAYDML
jgi:small neutral amino acid transporter SnatA (MarC family)